MLLQFLRVSGLNFVWSLEFIAGAVKNDLLKILDDNNVIKRSNEFKEDGLGSNKIKKYTDKKKEISIRTQRYSELKEL